MLHPMPRAIFQAQCIDKRRQTNQGQSRVRTCQFVASNIVAKVNMSPTLENLKPSQIAIPAGELIAVSGANGFMGSHICDQLLHLGYRVRGIVRNKERGAWLVNYFEEKYGPEVFELAQVPDMTVPRSCDDAVSGRLSPYWARYTFDSGRG